MFSLNLRRVVALRPPPTILFSFPFSFSHILTPIDPVLLISHRHTIARATWVSRIRHILKPKPSMAAENAKLTYQLVRLCCRGYVAAVAYLDRELHVLNLQAYLFLYVYV